MARRSTGLPFAIHFRARGKRITGRRRQIGLYQVEAECVAAHNTIVLSERQMELIAKALAEPRRVRILQDIREFDEPMQ